MAVCVSAMAHDHPTATYRMIKCSVHFLDNSEATFDCDVSLHCSFTFLKVFILQMVCHLLRENGKTSFTALCESLM
jgi:hypothetical protein